MSGSPTGQRVVFNADDFGRSRSINEAVIRAHREGVLTTASLLVNGEAFEEAVALARANPTLGVGLHLTLVMGRSTQPHAEIPGLVNSAGEFSDHPVVAGLGAFFRRSLRPQLEAEVAAQIAKFHATGLMMDHLNGHLNFHLHPTIFGILMRIFAGWQNRNQPEPERLTGDSPRPFSARGEGQGANFLKDPSRFESQNLEAPPLPIPQRRDHLLLHSEWRRGTGRGGAPVHGEGFANDPPVAADVRRLHSTVAPEVDQSLLTSAATHETGAATFLSPGQGDRNVALPAIRLTRDPFWLNAKLARGHWFYRASHALIFNLLSAKARPTLNRLGIRHADAVFGLLQNARVNEDYLLKLLPQLPAGDVEIYSHPCLEKFPDEFAALTSPFVKGLTKKLGIQLCRHQDL